jgi:hypothetical protein
VMYRIIGCVRFSPSTPYWLSSKTVLHLKFC